MGCQLARPTSGIIGENACSGPHHKEPSCATSQRDPSPGAHGHSRPETRSSSCSETQEQLMTLVPETSSCPLAPRLFVTTQKAALSDKFIKRRILGTGAYGDVVLCYDKATGAKRAVKIVRKSSVPSNNVATLFAEVEVVKQLDHPNIMKLYECFEDKKYLCLVMDVYEGGELFDYIISKQRLTESDAAGIIQQVVSGVAYLHKHQIVHRDLKPENILFESKAPDALIKIVDFGLSVFMSTSTKLKERLGTAYYVAPEVLKRKYDEKCDMWSVGVILYILLCGASLTGYPPFRGASDRAILQRIERGKFTFDPKDWDTVSEEAKDLVAKLLTVEPNERLSAEAALTHPWIVDRCEACSVAGHSVLRALGNMRRFYASQKLAQAALLFMGSKLTTLEETRELTKIFRTLDTNGDGQLDRNELITGYSLLRESMGDRAPIPLQDVEEEVDQILECADFDKNGYIEYSEFLTVAMDKKKLLSESRLQEAFRLFDRDGSGTIAANELREILIELDDAQWDTIIREVDHNNDGEVGSFKHVTQSVLYQVDFNEFVAMISAAVGDVGRVGA